ncbi:hypothetical protein GMJAKD_14885 [Candidatus Electrothrix aarhusensis]
MSDEWCRVRNILEICQIPECWGSFMYSSDLITGLDGNHYELWLSPPIQKPHQEPAGMRMTAVPMGPRRKGIRTEED